MRLPYKMITRQESWHQADYIKIQIKSLCNILPTRNKLTHSLLILYWFDNKNTFTETQLSWNKATFQSLWISIYARFYLKPLWHSTTNLLFIAHWVNSLESYIISKWHFTNNCYCISDGHVTLLIYRVTLDDHVTSLWMIIRLLVVIVIRQLASAGQSGRRVVILDILASVLLLCCYCSGVF